ncbi:MAG: hypothetical protein HY675_12740 [Chloroflexi bacterium]|nr:hypothetical protein [Chloroflexota bacterium]
MLHKRRFEVLVLSLVGALFALALTVGGASAHERRTLVGKYDVVVGWDKEPAFVNQQNAASIRIFKAGTQDPVQGVEKTLKVRIAFGGGEPKEFSLRAVFGQQGYYVVDLFATRAGRYIWTFVGDIEGTPVNEQFESGPGRFNDVTGIEELQFPQPVPDPLAMASEVRAAQNDAASARILAIVGIAAGLAGLAVGGLALSGRLRPSGEALPKG